MTIHQFYDIGKCPVLVSIETIGIRSGIESQESTIEMEKKRLPLTYKKSNAVAQAQRQEISPVRVSFVPYFIFIQGGSE
jgi:hypothetical protein